MNEALNIKTADLSKLNSMTKYPSIPTYHVLDPKTGQLTEEHHDMSGELIVTEKIDGANSRLILLPDGNYLICSREELLYAKGDIIGNPSLGIAEVLKPITNKIYVHEQTNPVVLYFETYGGKVSANSKQYTGIKQVSVRLFDYAVFTDAGQMLNEKPIEFFSIWRERDTSRFFIESHLQAISKNCDLPLAPRLDVAVPLPDTIADTYEWLKAVISKTRCALDDGAGMRPEGVVVRNLDRSKIVKIRFEDYERTMKKRK